MAIATAPYLDYPALAERLNLTVPTCRRLVREEGLPSHLVARRVKFLPDEVDGWVRARGAAETDSASTLEPRSEWVAETVARFTPDDLRRAAEILASVSRSLETEAAK